MSVARQKGQKGHLSRTEERLPYMALGGNNRGRFFINHPLKFPEKGSKSLLA